MWPIILSYITCHFKEIEITLKRFGHLHSYLQGWWASLGRVDSTRHRPYTLFPNWLIDQLTQLSARYRLRNGIWKLWLAKSIPNGHFLTTFYTKLMPNSVVFELNDQKTDWFQYLVLLSFFDFVGTILAEWCQRNRRTLIGLTTPLSHHPSIFFQYLGSYFQGWCALMGREEWTCLRI